MINKAIMNELLKKKSKSRIYSMICDARKQSGYRIKKEDAAYLIAGQTGVDIAKYLSDEQIEKIRTLQSSNSVKIMTKELNKTPRKIINIKIGQFKVQNQLLPEKIIKEAMEMANEVYPTFYVFENSVRNFILTIMMRQFGTDWWSSKVSNEVKKEVSARVEDEKNNPWHGSKRNVHEIFYTNFGDLKSIIIRNWDVFKNYFPRQDWVTSRFSDIEPSRNIIAHNNPLHIDDRKRIETYFTDWIKQSTSWNI